MTSVEPDTRAITQQPGAGGSNFLPPGLTVRNLTTSPEDTEFAARLMTVAFEPKLIHAVGKHNKPIMIKETNKYYGAQEPPFYKKVFIAECDGKRAGIAHLRFSDDVQEKHGDMNCEMGCCALCGLTCMMCALDQSKISPGWCYLDAIAVEDGFRGRGIGKALLAQTEQEARSRQCKSIYLLVMASNRAKNLYEREGYVVASENTCCCCLRCTVGEKSYYRMEKSLA